MKIFFNPGLPQINYRDTTQVPRPEYAEVLDEVSSKTGSPKSWILKVDSIKDALERPELLNLPVEVKVKGFENFILSNETVQAIFKETLPRGFVRNVNSIVYTDRVQLMPLSYGEEFSGSSQSAATAYEYEREIRVHKGASTSSPSWIAHKLFSHEFFHLNDAESNLFLTVNERIELYKQLVDRVQAPDRFKSNYVEKISSNDDKLELQIKANEYFAEIGATYLSPDYHLLPDADKKLVKEFIAKMDPDFDRLKALNARRALIGEEIPRLKSIEELTQEYLRSLPSIEEYRSSIIEAYKKVNVEITEEIMNKINEQVLKWYEEDKDRRSVYAREDYQRLLANLQKRGEI